MYLRYNFCNVLFFSLIIILQYWLFLLFKFSYYFLLIIEFNFWFCSSSSLSFLNFWPMDYLHEFPLWFSNTALSRLSFSGSLVSLCSYSPELSRFSQVLLYSFLPVSFLPMASVSLYNWYILFWYSILVFFFLWILKINCKCLILLSI